MTYSSAAMSRLGVTLVSVYFFTSGTAVCRYLPVVGQAGGLQSIGSSSTNLRIPFVR